MRVRTPLAVTAGVAAVAVLGSLLVASTSTFDSGIVVTAQFDSAAGLYVGNDVSVLGIPVGSVTGIEPHGSRVDVTMKIDSAVDIPQDVTAVTVSTSVLTDRHVEFTPPYEGGPTLSDGAMIALDHTRTPIEFDRLMAMASTLAQELQGDGNGSGPVADLLDVSSAMTEGNGPAMSSALTTLSQALTMSDRQGADTRNALTTTVDNLASLSSATADNARLITDFGTTIQQLTDVLAGSDVGTGDTGRKINDILAQATDLLSANRDGLHSTATDATTLTSALVDYRRQLAEFIDLTPLLLDNAYNAIDKENRVARVHAQLEKVFFDGQLAKEVCNLLGMKQLGCATGTLADYGPDFGISSMLEGLAEVSR